MGIPIFNKFGHLPPGIHETTVLEFKQRYITNLHRKKLFEGLNLLIIDLKRKLGSSAIYIVGSFITDVQLPHDVDVCWINLGIEYNDAITVFPLLNATQNVQFAVYSCHIFPAFIKETNSNVDFIEFFKNDTRTNTIKGIIKLKI